MADIQLNIPNRSLEDNFKLLHFQEDFSELLQLTLDASAKPKKIKFINNTMEVSYSSGKNITYKFEKVDYQITKIINMNTLEETTISW